MAVFDAETFGQYTIDRSRWRAVLISADSKYEPVAIDEIDGFTTEKDDRGDAGTFHLQMPLRANLHLAQVVTPMDLVAIFASRVSYSQAGVVTDGPLNATDFHTLLYGDSGAATVHRLAVDPTCVFIGMVDRGWEDYASDPEPHATLEIEGRDLTKIFLENDTFVPYTDPNGGQNGVISALASVAIPINARAGWDVLLDALNVYVKKDPSTIAQLSGPGATAAQYSSAAQYGYPWDQFVWYKKDPNFLHIPKGTWPNLSVQSGDAWVNLEELRNYPIARLFVSERGQLVFDSCFNAWTVNTPAYAINANDVVSYRFSQSDDDFVTVLSLMPNYIQVGDVKVSNVSVAAAAAKADLNKAIKRWGYRYQEFVAQYLPIEEGVTAQQFIQNLDKSDFWKALWKLHNNYWTCSVTVRGHARYKVGDRAVLRVNGANAQTRPAAGMERCWYVTNCRHIGGYGDAYKTELEMRFPADVAIGTVR